MTIKKAKTADVKSGDTIVLALQNVLQKGGTISAEPGAAGVLAIGLSTGIQIPENTDFGIILIIIEALYLRKLVDEKFENSVLENIIDTKQTIILDRRMSASIARIADEIAVAEIPEIFQHFYYKVKAEELICHLFIKLTSRQKSPLDSLNISDVEAIYKVRAILLKHLSNPPTVTQLAKMANMSESKLKRLFKQIFGTSVFNYYQSFRMKEAARMLKQRKFTVKEVANKLGFINLSHFSKIFAAYNGEKPKKYSMN
ncbi:helix-turn-helix transcriptional regulator [Niabella ginsenosidivorans]|uniref:helix-turn-helix transcriptional regulator n=1 Tax=Niabella ginsenosidivorans TaxID=1176587 RepID=UPI001471F9D3|nr:AraC family transcriptional regulator [Niabella ginsenosidivorans]